MREALIIGTDGDRRRLLAVLVGEITGFMTYQPGKMNLRRDPAKNWIHEGANLVIVDYRHLDTGVSKEMNLEGIDTACAKLEVPLIIVAEEEDPKAYVVFGKGGPYKEGPNPPWRFVCKWKDRKEAFEKFVKWQIATVDKKAA